MGKYQFSYEEKITIIREHEENHKTLKAICEEYDISKSYLCYILRDYRQKGKESLKNTKYYSAEYKLKVIKRHFEDALLDKRCDLYGEMIRGKALRGEWFLGDISALSDNAISKCTALLGDILYNPQCAENYDTAPVVVYDIFESMKYADSVMKPLLDEMLNLFKDIYDL